MARKKRSSNKKAVLFTEAVFAAAAILITASPVLHTPFHIPTWQEIGSKIIGNDNTNLPAENELQVKYIDVGQGDSELLQCGGKTMLIDTGTNDGEDDLVRFIKDQGVKKVDVLVGTHPHEDHIGGMDEVIKNFDIGEVYMPKMPEGKTPTSKTYQDVLKQVQAKNLKINAPKPGDKIDFADCKVEVFAPINDYDDTNNMSIVLKVTHGENTFLFTGDAEKESEQDMIDSGCDLKAKVLKVGHHGSTTSSKSSFLKAVSPEIAVIEVGQDNSYNHPSKEIIDRINKDKIKIYRTDLNGTIKIVSDGSKLDVTTEK